MDPMDRTPLDPAVTAESATTHTRTFGHYRLIQKVGEGGMGEVWIAEQVQPVRRQVALKIIKAGMDTKQVVARFAAERQALALMDHPAIATVFDAGSTPEGRPYFAMEYVKGEPITTYCDRNRLKTRQRLELFILVCEGVQHAHQKGVIHRDIKPSNVLVAVPQETPLPKIIDFGVAKAMTHHLTEDTLMTELGALVGTPEYMSPEQADLTSLDIDTRADVYALGVLLYELLTGSLPFDRRTLRDRGLDEIRRTIREVDPPRPSTRVTQMGPEAAPAAKNRHTETGRLAMQLRGDLDWITMKALEKDRTRRYDTVRDLANDVRRHLADEPVAAGPPSAVYRATKFARRHRFGVAAAVAVLILLVAFGSAMALQARRIALERDRANREAETARTVSAFLVDLFQITDPMRTPGPSITAREILERGAAKLDRDLSGQPLTQATLMMTMARVYMNMGLYPNATALAERALALRRSRLGSTHPDVADSLHMLGELRFMVDRYAEAVALMKEAMAIREAAKGRESPELAVSLNDLGVLAYARGQFAEAEPLLKRALAIRERATGPEAATQHAETLHNLATLYHVNNRYAEAEEYYRRTIALKEQNGGAEHPSVATTRRNLASLYQFLSRYQEARQLYEQALATFEKTLGPEHPEVADTLKFLGSLYAAMGDVTAAEPPLRRALAISEKTVGPGHRNTAAILTPLGVVADLRGRPDEAEVLERRVLAIVEPLLGPKHRDVANALATLGWYREEQGALDEAEQLYRRALEIRQAVAAQSFDVGLSVHHLARLASHRGRYDEAERLFDRALPLLEKRGDTLWLALALEDRAKVDLARGRAADALRRYERAMAIHEKTGTARHPWAVRAARDYAAVRASARN